jgi:hypothetical protein
MSTNAEPNDGIDVQASLTATPAEDERDDLLEQLRDHLDALPDVSVDAVDAHCCGALGCHRTDGPHWRVDVDKRRTRTLCVTHAVDFTRTESRYDV